MTSKRFKNNGTLIFDGATPLNTFEVVDKLNELEEEREIAIDGVRIADELIKKYGSDELKLRWKKEVTVKYR